MLVFSFLVLLSTWFLSLSQVIKVTNLWYPLHKSEHWSFSPGISYLRNLHYVTSCKPPLLCVAMFWGLTRMKEVLPQHDISFLIQYKNGVFRVDHLHIVPISGPTVLPSCMNA